MKVYDIIQVLEVKLAELDLYLEITICGGAAIQMLGYSNRPTKDIDVILPKLPDMVTPLIREIAQEHHLAKDWLNNGPEALIHKLEPGWEQRSRIIYDTKNLVIRALSRQDLIFSKLYAMCDRREDIRDLIAMKVTGSELHKAGILVKEKDGHPDWPDWVDQCIDEIFTTQKLQKE